MVDGQNNAKRRRRTTSHPRVTSAPITIDVGGTLFRVSRTTLTNSSVYFESMFSARWRWSDATGDDDSDQDVIFVDQDPTAFETLLKYK